MVERAWHPVQPHEIAHVIDFARKSIIKPQIGHSLELADYKKAFELGESGNANGKIVLAINT